MLVKSVSAPQKKGISLQNELQFGCIRQASIRNVLYSPEEFYHLCIKFHLKLLIMSLTPRGNRDFSLLSFTPETKAPRK